MHKQTTAKIIGDRLRCIRKSKGLSQEELADLSNLHPTYIGQLERGEKNATIESIEKVSKALDVTLGEFFSFTTKTNEVENEQIIRLAKQLDGINPKDQAIILKIIKLLLDWKDITN